LEVLTAELLRVGVVWDVTVCFGRVVSEVLWDHGFLMSKGHVAQKQTLECSNLDDKSGNAGTTTGRHEALVLLQKLKRQ
jgi:hypothetical protein